MKIITKAPIYYTSDCGNTYLNADGSPSYGPDLPAGFGVLKPGEVLPKQQPPAVKNKNNAANKIGSLVGSGKVSTLLDSAGNVLNSAKNLRKNPTNNSNAGISLPSDNSAYANDKKVISPVVKIGIAISAVVIISVVIYFATKKKK